MFCWKMVTGNFWIFTPKSDIYDSVTMDCTNFSLLFLYVKDSKPRRAYVCLGR